jgi:hypothetical protein
MNVSLQSTIHEAIQYAPPEHLELALTAIIDARFSVWPKVGQTIVRGLQIVRLNVDTSASANLHNR